jgi:molybdate transport system substrate-binding protein
MPLDKMLVLLGAVLMCLAAPASGAEVRAAVAANFAAPMAQLATLFQHETGHTLVVSLGSSGKLHAQIKAGAPFDIFLAADELHPQILQREGQAVAGSDFVYALGKLVLWSKQPAYVDDQGKVLSGGSFRKLAIADPKLAPYGVAAQQTLQQLNLWTALQPKLVTGVSIAQAYQFAATENAQLAFIALSQITRDGKVTEGSSWLVPAHLYSPIRQSAVLLAGAENNAAAQRFLQFLQREKAAGIIRSYGYALP